MVENDAAWTESGLPAKLSKPALRALQGAGYVTLEQVAQAGEAELLKLHGMGPKALEQLRQAIQAKGMNFADKTEA
ncbi:DNA-directed RNA polymerase alpha subunit [Paenibacillus forsythiae]|uniref:DNA-directed RNA polymerase alpha subunit n=2 Tax=Paenibacillus forsythiae TaxID=365616 RepID=A0ABU3HDT6_9BACL|nr:helix-hairpin-helix domain-containing protein [Paenibacillus forsythiae]MDT3428958.1 DNA-directed RNA polymerase alpha subunit [Paenibacillus forsythiae]